MLIYLIYGPQGSGKTTQAKLLAQQFNLIFISAGHISRDIAKTNETVRNLIDRGEPTPQEIIAPAINAVMEKNKNGNGFVFDGYPRYAQQIESLVAAVASYHWDVSKVIIINLSEKEGVERILARAKIEGRKDDTPESIRRRLELYHQQTVPIIDYFKKLGKVVEVDGSGTIEEVHNLIISALNSQ